MQISAAKAVYRAARNLTSAAGVTVDVLQCVDALAQADNQGILAEVRRMAGGMKLGLARRPSKRS